MALSIPHLIIEGDSILGNLNFTSRVAASVLRVNVSIISQDDCLRLGLPVVFNLPRAGIESRPLNLTGLYACDFTRVHLNISATVGRVVYQDFILMRISVISKGIKQSISRTGFI